MLFSILISQKYQLDLILYNKPPLRLMMCHYTHKKKNTHFCKINIAPLKLM